MVLMTWPKCEILSLKQLQLQNICENYTFYCFITYTEINAKKGKNMLHFFKV